jgi:hypothetical protein
LVWCGNGHNSKRADESWKPMAYCFQELSATNPFSIDQIRTENFEWDNHDLEVKLLTQYPDELTRSGGTMGFLRQEIPSSLEHYHMLGTDAFLLSTQNEWSRSGFSQTPTQRGNRTLFWAGNPPHHSINSPEEL